MTFTTSTFVTRVLHSGVLNLLWWSHRQIVCNYTFLWTNLTVKVNLSSVLMLRLHLELFFSRSVCNNCFKFSNFGKFILKYLKNFSCHLSKVQTKCEILLPLILLVTRYESSIFVFFSLFFFYKKVKPTSYDHILLTTIQTYDCQ